MKHTGRRCRTDHFLVNFGGEFTDACFIITNVVTYITLILLNVLSIIFQKSLFTHKVQMENKKIIIPGAVSEDSIKEISF